MIIVRVELIAMLRGFVAVSESESVTCAVKLVLPITVGVPLITPELAFRESPGGRVPDIIDHEFDPLPPVAASCAL